MQADASAGASGDATASVDAGPVCAGSCDDGNPCTKDACTAGVCSHKPETGLACNDGDACTANDACKTGACTGTKTMCTAVDGCHLAGICNPTTGTCSAPLAADGTPCTDGNVCTVGDACQFGVCLPKAITDCDDGNPCTVGSCASAKGCTWLAKVGGEACDDANPCTDKDVCTAGKCAGKATACSDGNPCTADYCDTVKGCVGIPSAATCSDGNACTVGDGCADGACKAGANKPDCDDKNACTKDSCAEVSGCVHTASAEACDDGNKCTTGDKCSNGTCAAGTWSCQCQKDADCANSNPCAIAICSGNQCVYSTKSGPCDDKNLCTTGETCANSACGGGKPVVCDDGQVCTADACDPAKGCASAPAPVQDSNCGTNGVVSNGRCYRCIAVNDLKADAAEVECAKLGIDAHLVSIASVGENNAAYSALQKGCAASQAWIGIGATSAAAAQWTDGSAVTYVNWGAGGPLPGTWAASMLAADGKWTSTFDTAKTLKSALCEKPYEKPCDDGSVCSATSFCQAGKCTAGFAAAPCDDGKPCTQDSCDPVKGCVALTLADGANCGSATCSAGVYTGISTCKAGACVTPANKPCDDGNVCTADTCDVAKGCASTASGTAACSDNNPCTTGDACANGTCKAGSATLACDDGNNCTDDKCETGKGCTTAPKTYSGLSCAGFTWNNHCYEAFPINGGYAAMVSKCQGLGGTLATIHSADENAQVLAAANKACGNAVGKGGFFGLKQASATDNASDQWIDGSPVTYTNWYAGEPNGANEPYGGMWLDAGTWNDFGEPINGDCAVCERLLGPACNDASICTQGDVCSNGVCGGVPLSCDDKNACTAEACDAKLGCTFTALAVGAACAGASCDGVKYATKSTCPAGSCVQSAPTTCNDGKDCTWDLCDPAKGCVAIAYTCADNNPCTDDKCTGGLNCSFAAVSDGAASCKGEMWRGHCYEAATGSNQTLETVEAACAQNKGWLASIHSADENEAVRLAASKGCGSVGEALFGLVQASTSDNVNHKWLDGTPYSYQNWSAGEPSLASEQRTRMYKATGNWNDTTMTTGSMCWVCERVPGTTCNDNNPCSVNDACFLGECTGAPQTCDDGVACTLDQCTAASGCSSAAGKKGAQYTPLFCDGTTSSKQCTTAGVCESVPATCAGKQCGFDGSAGDCGKCALTSVCTAAGQCALKANYAQPEKVLVSGGAFAMGCTAWNDTFCATDTLPRHVAYINSFYLDTNEVSQAKYKTCVAAGKCTVPGGGGYDTTDDNKPIVKLTWAQAKAYCTAAGGDLPTEAQWEFAARTTDKGVSNTIYPWGNNWPPPNLANIGNTGIVSLGDPYPNAHDASFCYGKNSVGACNMIGDVSEWMRDYYASNYPTNLTVKDPLNATVNALRAFRGMSWFYSLTSEAAPYRRFFYDPNVVYTNIGVRCAYEFKQ